MSPWRRGAHATGSHGSPKRARRAGRAALVAAPTIALAVIVLALTGVLSTFAQFTASITNNSNHVQTGSVGLTEGHNGVTCATPGNGQWFECSTINKYGAGGQTVTLQNTGTVAGHLSLLPSACTDTEEGAGGPLCDGVSVTVSCQIPSGSAAVTVVPLRTLNAFAAGRNFPTGYPVGTLQAGQSASCTFTLTGQGSITGSEGLSQPLAWKLS